MIPLDARIEPRWRRWLAESKLLKVDDGTLVSVLMKNGIHPALASRELQEIPTHPYFQAADNMIQLARKMESIMGVQRDLAALSPEGKGKITRRVRLTREQFLEEFYSRNRPVLITGMMKNWKALTAWTPEYLKEKVGDTEIEVQVDRNSDPLYERNLEQHRKRMPFGQYVDLVTQAGETNDFYMVANNKNFDHAGPMRALLQDVQLFPAFIDAANWQDKVFFWYGPKGTITPLHHDPMNVMLAQVKGTKRVKLISPMQTPFMYNYVGVFSEVDAENPDLERYPLYRNVRSLDFILEPGQVLFIPVGWWHAVVSLDKSISVSMTNFVFPNKFSWQDPFLVR